MITKNRLLWALALTPLFWLILVFLGGSHFSFPQTDDFCTFGRLIKVNANNPFLDTWYMYLNWSGRYSSMFIVAFSGWIASVVPFSIYTTYSVMIGALLLAFLGGCLAFFDAMLKDKRLSFSIAMVAFAVSVLFMPSRLEGVFWLTGVAVYVTGIATLMFLLWSVSSDDRRYANGLVAGYPWASIVLIVLGSGFNELLALSVGEFLFIRIISSRGSSFLSKQNILYIGTYVVSFVVSVSAPGNFIRDKTSLVPRREFWHALSLTRLSFEHLLHGYIAPNIEIMSLALVGIGLAAWAIRPANVIDVSDALPSILTLISALPVHILVYSFLTGEEAPGRVINECYIMTLLGLCVLSAWIGCRVSLSGGSIGSLNIARTALFAVGVLLISSTQFRQVVDKIRTFGPIWQQQQMERVAVLQAGKGKSVTLGSFSKEGGPTPIFQGSDITGDPKYWVNQCMSNFYGTSEIRLRESSSTADGALSH